MGFEHKDDSRVRWCNLDPNKSSSTDLSIRGEGVVGFKSPRPLSGSMGNASASPTIQVSSISFEHHTTGFGIGHARPRVSWRFATNTAVKNWIQDSYEIQIERQKRGSKPELYQIRGRDSVLVPWPCEPLNSRERLSVKVRAQGRSRALVDELGGGEETPVSSEWSNPATVEAALLKKSDWTARFITSSDDRGPDHPGKNPVRPLRFRKVFQLPQHTFVSQARVYVTAYGVYRMFINGHRVGDEEMSPGWTSYKHRLNHQVFDVGSFLRKGKDNVVAIEVGAGWYAGRLGFDGRRCLYGGDLAVLAQLEVSLQDGQLYTLNTDVSWKSHCSSITHSEIYDGETYDTREEQRGWCSDPTFDESSWTTTRELPTALEILNASDLPPVRCTEVKKPIDIFRSRSGKLLVDFGQNLVGKLRVNFPTVSAAEAFKPGGHSVSFLHAEVLENGELGTRPLRSARCVDQVVLSDTEPFTWSPAFTFHGFRYVQIDGWPTDTELKTSDLEALILHSDMRLTGSFECSEPLVNKLHENTLWSMRGNFLSLPTDCPQRDERLGWTGDIQVFGPSANYLYDTTGFLGNWLQDVSAEQLEDGRGGVPSVIVPDLIDNPIHNPPQAVWNDVTVLLPWDLYLSSGDKDILRRQYASMTAWVDRGIPRGPNGLWDPNLWQFGDWLDPSAPPEEPGAGRTDCILVADAYLVRVTETMARVAECLGLAEDQLRYSDDARRLKSIFQYQYVAASGLLVGDTQTALSLALCFGLHQSHEQRVQAADRLAHLVQSAKYRISTGFVGTPLITHALSDTGHPQLAYRMLLESKCPSWLYPITMGATTTWERWDSMLPDGSINPGSMTSFNHYALGSIVHWLYKVVGGISPRDPGWRTVEIRPIPGGTISSATATYESPFGLVSCSWSVCEKDAAFTLEVTIPLNCRAVIFLPSQQQQQQVKVAGGVAWGEAEETGALIVGSGSHKFTCPYSKPQWPPKAIWDRSEFALAVEL